MKRFLFIGAVVLLLGAAPAQALDKQTGTRTMADGTVIAYDLYLPDGTAPAGGWPGVIVLHGLGGSKDDMTTIASTFASHGYAALAYTARGEGTSTGNLGLAGPDETSDERAMFTFFAGLPEVSDTQIGAWGISYGGGETWNGLAAGIPYKAAEVVETWTDLYSALWPQNVAKSGIVLGFAKAVESRSPLIQQHESDAIHSTNMPSIRALVAPRSAYAQLPSIKTPVYMFQGRVDYAFDVSQAENGFRLLGGPKKLYVGQFGHTPSTFPGPDVNYVLSQGVAWYDHWLKGTANGIDKAAPVTIAAATGAKRATYATLPKTKAVVLHSGAKLKSAVETFGVSTIKVRVKSVNTYPRLVATITAGSRVITHGAIVPKVGLDTIRLANYVQFIPKGARITIHFGPDSGAADIAYLGFADQKSISLGAATLSLQTLPKPVSG
ncbi:MAG TPA: CocE/NonD family hydrolase [Gaiellaceae bacterium]|nr:CocE/NonD family hydrolase [Gaiellaceae bacterium]